MDFNVKNPTLAEFLAEESSPSTHIQSLTNQAISLFSSRNLSSPFFPAYFIPNITFNIDGHNSTGLQSLLSAQEQLLKSNPELRIRVLGSSVDMKSKFGSVTCSIQGEAFANGVSRKGTVMTKWISTDDGWRCGEWRIGFERALSI